MDECTRIDALVTPYVDDELASAERSVIDRHLRVCVSCHTRVAAERDVCRLIHKRKLALASPVAPPALRARALSALASASAPIAGPSWQSRARPLAMAAALVLIVGTAFLYQATQLSSRLMAAELAADHVKCFLMNDLLGTSHTHEAVESAMASGFEWQAKLPRQPEAADLELVGARPCLYGQGRVAHIMYKHDGEPVSVFMLPNTHRTEEYLAVFGHEAAIWSEGNRTFVLVTREPRAEVQRMASFVRSSLR